MAVKTAFLILITGLLISCKEDLKTYNTKISNTDDSLFRKGTYAYDANFLRRHSKVVVELESENGTSKILLSADYQGRVMTSTASGDTGNSFGWINHDLMASGDKKTQFNPVGGEERFWLGPEGGQFALYFKKGDSFNISSWKVPPVIDTEPFDLSASSRLHAVFAKRTTLHNYSGKPFDLTIERKIRMMTKNDLETKYNVLIPEEIRFVAYESKNSIRNVSDYDWKKETGLLSIWLLGMFTPSAETIVILPFHVNRNSKTYITTDYFGKIPDERLNIEESVLFFRCDGKFRSKIGISPKIAKPVAGSYDFTKNILTLILFEIKKNAAYVNSKWEVQKEPYQGDVVNSYNDGPLSDGSQLGFFYELESSSPALELRKRDVQEYTQVTCHFEGNFQSLNEISTQLLGIDLTKIPRTK